MRTVKKEIISNLDMMHCDWTLSYGNIIDKPVKSFIKRDLKIRSLKKFQLPKLNNEENKFFSLFREGKDVQAELKRVCQKIVKPMLLQEQYEDIEKLLDGTPLKFNHESVGLFEKEIVRITSKKGYEKCFVLTIDDSLFVCSEKGCKASCQGKSWMRRSDGVVATAEDIYYLIGVFIAIKELERISKDGYDFSKLLSKRYNYKVWRLVGNQKYQEFEVPVFGAKEAATMVLGENIREVDELCNPIYSLIYDDTLNLPKKKTLSFKRGSIKKRILSFQYDVDNYDWFVGFQDLLEDVVSQQCARKKNARYEKESSSTYAKSFQTKKNINKETIKAMKKSAFNRFFKFVEFDNEVDLNKIEEIYKEFEAFNVFLFGEEVATPEVELRFRKLGNHKAAGLYYPEHDCICIDISNPYSFVHEYGHMLDYHSGNVSEQREFKEVRDAYESAIKAEIKEKQIKLSGKYKLNYYLTPTEIFARSFEYYMRFLGLDNSIVGRCEDFAYPKDEFYKKRIKRYFEEFFDVYIKRTGGGEEKCAST